jgi:hypothetical protein
LKILGIGTAERNWKQIKAVKLEQRTNKGMDKTKKQVMIYSQYQQMKAQAHIQKLSWCVGKLWDDNDFKSMKMDEHCKEIEDALEVDKGIQKGRIRLVKIWVQGWEKNVLGPSGDDIFEARLVRKYVVSSGLIQMKMPSLQHIQIRCILRRSAGTIST